MRRILVVADVSNLYYCLKKKFKEQKLNYKKFLTKAVGQGQLYRAIAYGAQMNNEADSFFECLRVFGFQVKVKRPSEYVNKDENGTDIKIRKADFDVEIAIDIVRHLSRVDVVVIGSADGDMVPVVRYAKERGVIVHVIGSSINHNLKEIADESLEIGPELLEYIRDAQDDNSADTTNKT